jgi:predicted RNA binding protein YcfA (HicA-like mRNA interferase family)
MPAKAKTLEKVAKKLSFQKTRQKGSHARWQHPDGRSTTIPTHGNSEIGGWLFQEILEQLGITEGCDLYLIYCIAAKNLVW